MRKLLKVNDLTELLGIGRATLSKWRKDGTFPDPVKLGTKMVAWREEDIDAWLESRKA